MEAQEKPFVIRCFECGTALGYIFGELYFESGKWCPVCGKVTSTVSRREACVPSGVGVEIGQLRELLGRARKMLVLPINSPERIALCGDIDEALLSA